MSTRHCRVEDASATFSSFRKKQDKSTARGVGQESCADSAPRLAVPEQAGSESAVQLRPVLRACTSAVVI